MYYLNLLFFQEKRGMYEVHLYLKVFNSTNYELLCRTSVKNLTTTQIKYSFQQKCGFWVNLNKRYTNDSQCKFYILQSIEAQNANSDYKCNSLPSWFVWFTKRKVYFADCIWHSHSVLYIDVEFAIRFCTCLVRCLLLLVHEKTWLSKLITVVAIV